MESDVTSVLLGTAFALALVFGAVANRTNFCTMGAVSDWVNIGDLGRMRAWLTAVAVALAGTLALEALGWVNLDASRIPYRSATLTWPRYILGGALFGIGMTLAGGCANKNLVRLGAGNLKSLFVLAVMGLFAYLMTRTDLYGIVFLTWMAPVSPDLTAVIGAGSQDLGAVLAAAAGTDARSAVRLAVGIVVVLALLAFAFGSRAFRSSADNVAAGLVVGALVAASWYLTGGPLGQEWMEAAQFADRPPEGVGVQPLTFVSPTADVLAFALNGGTATYLTFGMAILAGVIAGSTLYALAARSFRFEWFVSVGDFVRHLAGGALMGLGGVLALGCTIGQGVSGLSTLAIGSVLAIGAIIVASAVTMKVQYYRMVYEDASFVAALLSGLADLRLAPRALRKLDAI